MINSVSKLLYKHQAGNFSLILSIVAVQFFMMFTTHAQTLVTSVEAEIGTRAGGLTIGTSNAGYSGTGYVTNMNNAGDNLTIPVTVPAAGSYKLVIRYNGPYGAKDQDVYVNGIFVSNMHFPATTGYADLTAGALLLSAGNNTIAFHKNWGYTDFDKITLYTVPLNDYTTIVPAPIDPAATPEAIALYNYLKSNYGQKIISGQTSDYYNSTSPNPAKQPVIRAFDFQHYTVGYPYLWNNATAGHTFGWEDDGTTQAAIDWYNSTCQKGIVAFQWHWHSPSGGQAGKNTFSTSLTNFDVTKAVTQGTSEYTAVIRDIDSIATQLKRFQAAGVPVLWRPLHEAGGTWFWWGAKGPAAALKLYDMVYDRLVNHHSIHNLIWQWSTPEPSWYPGNAKVDMLGYDSYPGAYNYGTQKLIFDQLYTITNGQKMLAMTENGPIPHPEDIFTSDAKWSYFMSWSNLVTQQNSAAHLNFVYNHANVITLDEVAVGTNTAKLTAGGPTSFCTGGSVLLKANVAKGYTYKWYNGANVISGATNSSYTATAAGSYTVAVTATGTCTTTSAPVVVTVGGPTATITPATAITFCQGGSVQLNASTGSGYTYQWNVGGNPISGASNASYVANSTGLYSVKITSSTCNTTSAGTQVTVNAPPTAAITAGGATTFCQGSNVVLTASTGSSYKWMNGGNAITGATNSSYTAATSGTYTVEVTNASNCKAVSAATTVTVNALPTAAITAGGATTFCQGGNVVLTASTGSSYKWMNGGNAITGATNSSYTAATSGTYTVEVTNASNCKAVSAATTITVNALPTAAITAGGATTFCQGGNVVLTASTGSSYKWMNGGNAITGATNSSYTAATSGTYTVEVTNASNCKAVSAATTVTVNALPTAAITAGTNTSCQGISILMTSSSGSSYKWMLNGAAISGATNSTFIATSTGPYTVEVTNASNCKTTSAEMIFPTASLGVVTITAGGPTTFCLGGSVTLTASMTGASYKWMLNGNAISGATNISYVASINGAYTVEVMYGPNNCVITSQATNVTVEPALVPPITAGGATIFCQGESVALVTNSPGTSYRWFNSSAVIAGATNAQYTATVSGLYRVEVTHGPNCKSTSDNIQVDVTSTLTWYSDIDGDGTGDASASVQTCAQPAGYVLTSGDACPNDANKIAPGNCGCGETESSCLPTATQSAFASNIKMYPNPTADNCKIELAGTEFKVTIYTASGIQISSNEFQNEAIIGNGLPQGIYLVRIEQHGNVELRKLIKQ